MAARRQDGGSRSRRALSRSLRRAWTARGPGRIAIRAFVPSAERLAAVPEDGAAPIPLEPRGCGFFEGFAVGRMERFRYRLRAANAGGSWDFIDPYVLPPVLGAIDDHLLVEGTHRRLYERLGAHPMRFEGIQGAHFAVWAPHALRVSVVGDFNAWDGRRHQMRKRIDFGPLGNFCARRYGGRRL